MNALTVVQKMPGKLLHMLGAPQALVLRKLRTPRILVDAVSGLQLLRLGTEYGGWVFAEDPSLFGSTIICAGAGEDISFDIAFASKYSATVHIVDPTPRATHHVEQVVDRIAHGAGQSTPMNLHGGQVDVQSYDVSKLTRQQIRLTPYALWNKKGKIRFYVPNSLKHVSHSIINVQRQTEFIEVDAITIEDLVGQLGVPAIPLMKLDIEGAEVEVLEHMMMARIFPLQLLVEFDEMHTPLPNSKQRIARSLQLLRDNAYKLAFFNGTANFLFIRDSLEIPVC